MIMMISKSIKIINMVMIMISRLDLSRTASLDPTDGQSFAALGCTGNYDKWDHDDDDDDDDDDGDDDDALATMISKIITSPWQTRFGIKQARLLW